MRKTNNLISRTLRISTLLIIFNFIFPFREGLSQNVDKKHLFLSHELYIKLNKSICLSITVEDLKQELEEINSILTAEPLTNAHHINHTQFPEHCDNAYLIWKLHLKSKENIEQKINDLKQHALIEKVSRIHISKPLLIPNDPATDTTLTHHENGSYVFKAHNFFEAWDIETGDTNVFIGVVDAGFNLEHEDLIHSIKHNQDDPINGLNDDDDFYNNNSNLPLTDNYTGWDLGEWDNDPTQPAGTGEHGTKVTGILAATSNNGKGTAGTAYNSKFVPFKVTPDSDGEQIIYGYEGIILAAEQGCSIINCSWGTPKEYYTADEIAIRQQIINYAVFVHDAVVVASAGNERAERDYLPAALDYVCSVTATNLNERKLNRACYGYSIDMSAIGWNLLTTAHDDNDTTYTLDLGTSIATPVVSGAAALVRSRYPSMSAQQVIEQLKLTGDVIDTLEVNSEFKNKMGFHLNPLHALTDQSNPAYKIVIDSIVPGRTLNQGDTARAYFRIQNLLWASTSNANLTISTADTIFRITEELNKFQIPAMPNLAVVGPAYFEIVAEEQITSNTETTLLFDFEYLGKTQTDYKNVTFFADMVTASFLGSGTPKDNIEVYDLNQHVLVTSETNDISDYKIHNLMGKEIFDVHVNKTDNLEIDKSTLPKNRIYLLTVKAGNKSITKKIYAR